MVPLDGLRRSPVMLATVGKGHRYSGLGTPGGTRCGESPMTNGNATAGCHLRDTWLSRGVGLPYSATCFFPMVRSFHPMPMSVNLMTLLVTVVVEGDQVVSFGGIPARFRAFIDNLSDLIRLSLNEMTFKCQHTHETPGESPANLFRPQLKMRFP